MKVVILGCATSTGVPIIGCRCPVCISDNSKNKRTRCSLFIQVKDKNILIDSSTDLRSQALGHGITRLDAVLYTHSHADHTHGIDDLRTFNFVNDMVIPCFANQRTIANLKNNFGYIFDDVYSAGGKPMLDLKVVENEFDFDGINIIPVEINHSEWMILGYRIGNMAYLTDCSGIPDESLEKLKGLDLLILSALRYREHPAHFNVEQAVEMAQKINPKLAVLTHMGHEVDYDTLLSELPDNIVPAYDGMEVVLDEP